MVFSNAPPTSFGMPQPYSQTQPMHPAPSNPPTRAYPPQQMSYPSQSIPMPYPSVSNPFSNQPALSSYPQQQDYMYPNLEKAPDAKEYFSSMTPYPSQPNAYIASSNPYHGGNHPGGQRVRPTYPCIANPPIAAQRGATSAPRRDRFTPKVRLRKL